MARNSEGVSQETKTRSRPMLELIHSLLPEADRKPEHKLARPSDVERRRDHRIPTDLPLIWDYFSLRDGKKRGQVLDLSLGGASLLVDRPIEMRRWIRLALPNQGISAASDRIPSTDDRDSQAQLFFTLAARVVRRNGPDSLGRWKIGVQFVHPVQGVLLERIQRLIAM